MLLLLLVVAIVVAAALADGCWQLVNLKKELVPFASNGIVLIVVAVAKEEYMHICVSVCV